ncbi:CU044_5270 family protein [Williamsia sp. CHRR-6]|uniref:CU044_5270 family protein n=1 Tax=Williamsia sp. CHRR-6 TaxID=2835871 RepID=UPI001BD92511|nr:CU044_5270 family protein [Williamsia sp. CHRR-6]MBT0566677.1 CU044_5270 family protein [Williamsia sp. CHRR-6]
MADHDITDAQLDSALAHLNEQEPTMTQQAFDNGLTRLRAATTETAAPQDELHERRHRRVRPAMVAAASVAAVAAVAVAVPLFSTSNSAPASAATLLENTADRTTDFAPNPYRHITIREVGITVGQPGNTAYRESTITEQWTPLDPTSTWVLRQQLAAPSQWLAGRAGAGAPPAPMVAGTYKASCGRFSYTAGVDRCAQTGWDNPQPSFIKTLPTEPTELFNRLVRDAGGMKPAAIFDLAQESLQSGLLPAQNRAALFRALAKVKGLTVTSDRVTLDGRTGTGVGVRIGTDDHEIVIDPGTGNYLGSRVVVAADDGVLQAGTVRQSSSATVESVSTAPTA